MDEEGAVVPDARDGIDELGIGRRGTNSTYHPLPAILPSD
jgi:hypothetical protein